MLNTEMVGGSERRVSGRAVVLLLKGLPAGFDDGMEVRGEEGVAGVLVLDVWQFTMIDIRLLAAAAAAAPPPLVENEEVDEMDEASEFDEERRELVEPIEVL